MTERTAARERLTGKLIKITDSGYGFLSTGRAGDPNYFILRSQVEPPDWIYGRRFTFVAAPPRPGGSSPRAIEVEPLAERPPRSESAHLGAVEGDAVSEEVR